MITETNQAVLRGSDLESYTGWPRTWTAPDAHKAALVAEKIQGDVDRSGFADDWSVTVEGFTVVVDRRNIRTVSL